MSKRDYTGDQEAIAQLMALQPEAKAFLNHHIRNIVSAVVGYCSLGRARQAEEVALELIELIEIIAPLPMRKTTCKR